MAFSVQMPALGESVTEGTVTRWLKQEGDTVAVDEPLVEVSTDKVDTEIPSPAAGVLQKIVAAEDETVEVGAELAVIGDADDSGDTDDAGDSADADTDTDTDDSEDTGSEGADTGASDAPAPEPATSKSSGDSDGDSSGGDSSGGGGEGTSVTMPALGESVTEGTVTRWLKAVGDEVAVDEPLVEVSTDKVDTEIPSPVAGTLLEISADEDETVEVGAQLAVIGAKGASAPAKTAAPQPEEAQSADGGSGSGGSGSESSGDDASSGHSAEPQTEESGPDEGSSKTPLEEEADTDAAAHEQAAETEKPAKQSEEKAASSTPARGKSDTTRQPPSGKADDGQGGRRGSDAPAPYVTPLVRKLAAEKGVDLSALTGTGVGGRIRKQDVEAAAEKAAQAKAEPASEPDAAPAAAGPSTAPRKPSSPAGVRPELATLRGTTKKASRIRQITATKTRESLQSTAQLTQTFEVDMSRVAALRKRAKASFAEQEGVNLTYLPFFAKAVVEALKSHPNVNASYDEAAKEITYHGSEHLSVAVDTPAGLLSPVIHNAGDLSLAGLARAIADLAERARNNGLKPDELSGGTFTITNIGSQGALFDTPILVPPQAAMLGTGAIVKRPVVVTDDLGSDSIAVRSMCYLPLTYDHRLVDGADAGRFLTTLKHRLEEAAFEADLGL